MTSPEAPTEGDGSTEAGEPVAGAGSAATAAAAVETDDPGGLQVDLTADEDDPGGDTLGADDDAAVSGPPETEKGRLV